MFNVLGTLIALFTANANGILSDVGHHDCLTAKCASSNVKRRNKQTFPKDII